LIEAMTSMTTVWIGIGVLALSVAALRMMAPEHF
jgi:hypothetical protein